MMYSISKVESSLSGLECWDVGYNLGSGVLFELGGLVQRRQPRINPNLSDTKKEFRGTHNVYVVGPWTITNIFGAIIGNGLDGLGLSELVGTTITCVRISPFTFDLTIRFSNGHFMTAVNIDNSDNAKNYSIRIEDMFWVVSPVGSPREEVLRS
jgi:hypothetical protein